VIQAMAEVASQAGLSPLVAPVRPNQKDRYPLTPIERYAYWQRAGYFAFRPLVTSARPTWSDHPAAGTDVDVDRGPRERLGTLD